MRRLGLALIGLCALGLSACEAAQGALAASETGQVAAKGLQAYRAGDQARFEQVIAELEPTPVAAGAACSTLDRAAKRRAMMAAALKYLDRSTLFAMSEEARYAYLSEGLGAGDASLSEMSSGLKLCQKTADGSADGVLGNAEMMAMLKQMAGPLQEWDRDMRANNGGNYESRLNEARRTLAANHMIGRGYRD